MLLELIIALILGILTGTFTGIAPGIHINLIGAMVVSFSSSILLGVPKESLLVFIVAMSITHTFTDFIPSIFLGCPDNQTELSILPGHELLLNGHGYKAVMLTAYGGLIASIILVIIAIPAFLTIPYFYNLIKELVPYLLIIVCIFLIYNEKNKFNAFLVLIISGFLGLITLNFDLKEPLLPLLGGLFGCSSILTSIKSKIKIPEQKIENPEGNFLAPVISSMLVSPLCVFLPALGSGQLATISSIISKESENKRGFLVLLGATNIFVISLSFLSMIAIEKARSGSAVAIQKIIPELTYFHFFLIFLTILFSGIFSFYLTKKIAILFSKNIQKINYTLISILVLFFIFLLTNLLSGILGASFLIISTLTGIYCISLNVKRTNMMGCLIIPTILLLLF